MAQVDDAQMEVSTVIRAEEHLTNTVRQVLILKALGYTPPQYAHLALVLGEDRSKLSKRHGATSVICLLLQRDVGEAGASVVVVGVYMFTICALPPPSFISLPPWQVYEMPACVGENERDGLLRMMVVFRVRVMIVMRASDYIRWLSGQPVQGGRFFARSYD